MSSKTDEYLGLEIRDLKNRVKELESQLETLNLRLLEKNDEIERLHYTIKHRIAKIPFKGVIQ